MKKLDKKNIEDIFALTPMQEGMLFHYLKDPISDYYFEQLSLEISGAIEVDVFKKSWNFVIETNEMLRTIFRWENVKKPVQIILKERKLQPGYYDFTGKESKEKEVEEIKIEDRKEKFDLQEVPFRVTLCKLEKSKYVMMISNHHILYDGWSNGIILREFFDSYNTLSNGKELIKALKPKFKEFIKWIQDQDIEKQEKFWKDYLKGFDTQTELSIKRKKREAAASITETFSVSFSKDLKNKIEDFVKSHKITLASFLYSAWGLLLQKYNNTDEVIFGTVVSGRSAKIETMEEIVGLFINNIPLRINAKGKDKIGDLLDRVHNTLQLREEYENTPLMDIKKYSPLDHIKELFDSIVIIENYPSESRLMLKTSKLSIDSYSMLEMTHYDLSVSIEIFNEIGFTFTYKKELFDEDTIVRLGHHLSGIVKEIITDPNIQISELEITSKQEKHQILYEFNKSAEKYPEDKTISRLFEEQVKKTPDSAAIVGKGEHGIQGGGTRFIVSTPRKRIIHVTYRELNRNTNQLARKLIEKGIKVNDIVGIMMERSIEMVIVILGILKAGGAYLPIVPNYPEERIKYILEDSSAHMLVTTNTLANESENDTVRRLEGEMILLDTPPGPPLKFTTYNLPPLVNAPVTSLAYIIYTSGSTGRPKGVMVEQTSVVNVLAALQKQYPFMETDVYLFKTSVVFDVSVTELFGWFFGGGRLALLEKGAEKDPGKILDIIASEGVTHINFVPSMLNIFVDTLTSQNSSKLSSLKYIFLAGEALLPELVTRFRDLNTTITLENIYGPTEGTVYSSWYSLGEWSGSGNIPIGKPLPNVQLYILDKYDHLQPVGVPGELFISGVGVAQGYLNNLELTAEKFGRAVISHSSLVISPSNKTNKSLPNDQCQMTNVRPSKLLPNDRLYHSGDLCRWFKDGIIEFLGRLDHQVKIRGFRIELGEIENQIFNYDHIKEAVVTSNEDKNGDKYLCAYIVPHSPYHIEIPHLQNHLAQKFPDYMIPTHFVQLEQIPLTPTGKIDRKALPKPEIKSAIQYTAPRDKIEEQLVEIWSDVLGIEKEKIGIDDNFFELGGHSLKATIMISKIHKAFNVKLLLGELFKNPSIRKLSKYIQTSVPDQFKTIKAVEKKEYYTLSSAQKRLYILDQVEEGNTGYNISGVFTLEGEWDATRLEESFRKLLQRHDSFRTSFPMVEEQPVQRIHDEVEFEIKYYSLEPGAKGMDRAVYDQEAGTNSKERASNDLGPRPYVNTIKNFIRPFELSRAPLLRVELMPIENQSHLLMVDIHHIISDGLAIRILQEELAVLYSLEELPPLHLQYKDYSEWQNSKKEIESIRQQEKYWLKEFESEIPILNLSTDFLRPEIQSFEGNTLEFKINGEEKDRLNTFALAEETTLFMIFLSIFNVFLAKLSRQEDIVVGSPVAGRRYADLEQVIGIFINTLALRNYPSGEKTFKEFLKETRDKTLSAQENQEYPFEDLVENIPSIKRDVSRNPLFDVMFTLEYSEFLSKGIPGLQVTPYLHEHKTAKVDMSLAGLTSGENLVFSMEYCTKLFKEETIQRFICYFKMILSAVVKNPWQKISEIEIIPDQEKQQILYDFNNTRVEYPQAATIHEMLAEQAARTPDYIALVYQRRYLTYRELNRRSNQLANELRRRGVKPDTVVGIMMESSSRRIAAMLAILKAGGAYLPIDPALPVKRIVSMLEDCQVSILLTQTNAIRHPVTVLENLYRVRSQPQVTDVRQPLDDLDNCPLPDRSLVNYDKYMNHIGQAWVKHSVAILATRGCPYKCAYCHNIWPKKHLVRSAENIFAEVKLYYDMGVRRFVIIDDIFNLNVKNSRKFFQLIIDNGLDLQLFFPNGMRGDLLTKEYIDLMVKAGTVSVALALETASPRLQKLIGKNLNIKKFRENLEYLCETYPHVISELFTMHGFPTETEEEALMTLDFIKSIKGVHFPYINILRIYSNTKMVHLAVKNGISHKSIFNSENLYFHELPDTLPFNKEFTLKVQSDLLSTYFLSKERLLHVLPFQMKIFSRDELVRKYNSYLPAEINSFSDLLQLAKITEEELGTEDFLDEACVEVPRLHEKMSACFPPRKPHKDALRLLLLDLSQFFTADTNRLDNVFDPPLGLLFVMSYMNRQLDSRVHGRIAKSRVDFDNFYQLKALVEEFKPDIIGMRTLTYYRDFFHQAAALIRQWGFDGPIVAGGPYATSNYNTILQDRNIDLVVLGEGEVTFTQLVEKMLEHGKKLPGDKVLKEIPGLAFMANDQTQPAFLSREIILLEEFSQRWDGNPGEDLEPVAGPGNLAYMMFTSGSTGEPKGVLVEHRNVVNNLHWFGKTFNLDTNVNLMQLSDYNFDPSVEDIFGSLVHGATLHVVDKELILEREKFRSFVRNHQVHIIDHVPIVLDQLLGRGGRLESLRVVISGGMPLEEEVKDRLIKKGYPLYNNYGPTEITVDALYEKCSGEKVTLGHPISNVACYILDRYNQLVPIGVPGELVVSGNGVTRGYINDPELTAEKFDHDFWDYRDYRDEKNNQKFLRGGPGGAVFSKSAPPGRRRQNIYKTGDLARWLPDGRIEFLGRIDNQVKVRGFRIELGEIESQLLNKKGINEAVVIAREDETGSKYLCAYIISDTELVISDLKEDLSKDLPVYMIPSYIVRLEKIPLTPNGKIDRKALPHPYRGRGETYVEPMDEIEKKLVWIWADVLGIEKGIIGINDSFFELGGHSLSATRLVSNIYKVFHTEVGLIDVFKMPTVKELSCIIKNSGEYEYTLIGSTEKKEYYPLSSAQKRLYFVQQMEKESTAYNMVGVFELNGIVGKEKLEKILVKMITRHESLRTSFELVEGEPVQRIHNHVKFEIQGLTGPPGYFPLEDETFIRNFLKPFDLTHAPLLRVSLMKLEEKKHIVILDMHHIISDGISLEIFEREFMQLYAGEELVELNLQYKDYSQWQNRFFDSEKIKEQEKYWLKQFKGEIPQLNLPFDYQRPVSLSYEGDEVIGKIGAHETRSLRKMAMGKEVTLNMILLALFNILLSKYTDQEDIVVGIPVSGREHRDLDHIIGMFVNMLPLRNFPSYKKCFIDFLDEVKDGFLNAITNQDYQFDTLIEKLRLKRDPNRHSLFNVTFHFINNAEMPGDPQEIEIEELKIKPYDNDFVQSKFDLLLTTFEFKDEIAYQFTYCTKLFKKNTIEKMSRAFKRIVEQVSQTPEVKIYRIDIIDASTLNNVLTDVKIGETKSTLIEGDPDRLTTENTDVQFNF